ncbi:hypothetical protein THRCLA_11019 [Thraustotheca clavata]|uniref:Uncharacterized protein n=1 Tax=Thraustotheca clavata TaxID=74557 RepID=A0A1V9Y9H1_9STRA|nr:hypothetical protein THRCLA_11019 [Thraustotheca clavata]
MVVIAGGSSITCTHKCCFDAELQTKVGRVKLDNLEVVVLPADEDEFILGNATMQSLGIDVHSMLEKMARPVS